MGPVGSPGELITERFGFDGGRNVSAYVPQGDPKAIIFCGDGQLIPFWGPDLERRDLPLTMIVGAHRHPDDDLRIHEYSPGFDLQRFEAHEAFLVGEVVEWVCARFGVDLPADRTATCGVSASGELALALAVRHPDRFGVVFCASPGGGFRPPDPMPDPRPRTYLVAGTEEPWFLGNAVRWKTALGQAGADVVMTERSGTHGDRFWRAELPLMVEWAFA